MHPFDHYDPWEHAHRLELVVHRGTLSSPDHDGEYYDRERLVMLRRGLTWRQERCVLAHEIVHAEYRDRPTTDPHVHAKREARCDRIAAHRLIHPEQLQRTMREYRDAGDWCLELDITADLLQVYLDRHPDLLHGAAEHEKGTHHALA